MRIQALDTKNRVALILTLLALLSGAVFVDACRSNRLLQEIDQAPLTLLNWIRGSRRVQAPVLIVALDSEAQRHFGVRNSWEWPRILQARIFERLREFHAAAVALDIFYNAPLNPPENDQALARAIGAIPTTIGTSVNLSRADRGVYESAPSIAIIQQAAARSGHMFLQTSWWQSVLTHFPTVPVRLQGAPTAPLYLEAARLINPQIMPPEADALINFYGPAGTVPTLSVATLLDAPTNDPALLRQISGRLVFVGLVDDVQGERDSQRVDFIRTSASRWRMPGVEAHATMSANLLETSWLRRLPPTEEKILGGAVAALITLLLLLYTFSVSFFATIPFSIIWLSVCFLALKNDALFLPPFSPLLVALCTGLLGNLLRGSFLLERKLRAHRRRLFDMLPEETARQYADIDDLRELNVERDDAIVLATDLEGYAATRSGLTVNQLKRLEEHYRHAIVAALAHGERHMRGIPVKFVGDALTAYFPTADCANALRRAGDILRNVEALVPTLKAEGLPCLKLRIGLARGAVICGVRSEISGGEYVDITTKVGSDAARLESLNKVSGTHIALPGNVRMTELEESFPTLFLGKGALNQGDENLTDVYVVMPSISQTMREIWTPLLAAIAVKDVGAIMELAKQCQVTTTVLKTEAASEYDLADSTKEHPIIAFSKPTLAKFSRGELLLPLTLFFYIGQREPLLKTACRSYIFAINHLLDPMESTRHLGRALEMLKTIVDRQK